MRNLVILLKNLFKPKEEKIKPIASRKQDVVMIAQNIDVRTALFKRVFNNDDGQLVIDYLKYCYDFCVPCQDAQTTYYALGKKKAIQEIEALTLREIKNETKVKGKDK